MLIFNGYIISYNIQHYNNITISQNITGRQTSTTTKKNTKIYLGKPSRGRRPNKNFLCIRCIKDRRQDPKTGVPSSNRYVSFSLSMRYAQVNICVFQMRSASLYLYSPAHLIFHSTMSAPLNLTGPTFLGRLKTLYYYISEGAIDLTYNGGVFLMTLR